MKEKYLNAAYGESGGEMNILTYRKMTGRCSNGFERDGGKLIHAVVSDKYSGWSPALCRAVPGPKGNGWSDKCESKPTCPRCIIAIAKAEGK